jgi:uncharacterized protein with HEPN domain
VAVECTSGCGKNPAQRLRDIVDNIDAIVEFTARMDRDDFAADRKTVYAVVRALEIISEATRRLPPELKERHNWAETCTRSTLTWERG